MIHSPRFGARDRSFSSFSFFPRSKDLLWTRIRQSRVLAAIPIAISLVIALVSFTSCYTPFADRTSYYPPSARRALGAESATSPTAAPAGDPSLSRRSDPGTVSDSARHPEAGDAASPRSGSRELGLAEAIQTALERNRNITLADRRILIAEDRKFEAMTNLLPRITATATAQVRNNDLEIQFQDEKFNMGDKDVVQGKVQLLVPLYTFGLVTNQIEAEEIRGKTAEYGATRARQELILAVSLTYFRVLESRKILGVVEESLKVVERQLEIARDFHSQGLVAKSDVLSAEVQSANREEERIQASNNVDLATASLNRLMGIDIDAPTRLADVLEGESWKGSFDAALAAALRGRPDLRAVEEGVALAQAEYRVTRAGHAPYLYGYGDYNVASDDYLANKDWLQGGIALTIPLFDGLSTYTKLRRRSKEIAEAVDLRDDRLDDIVLEVKQAYLNVDEATRRVPVARQSIEEAEENLRMIRDQYSEGWVSSTDVLVEEDRLSRARSNYYRALYDYHAAFARLTSAVGGNPPADSTEDETNS